MKRKERVMAKELLKPRTKKSKQDKEASEDSGISRKGESETAPMQWGSRQHWRRDAVEENEGEAGRAFMRKHDACLSIFRNEVVPD